MVTQAGGMPFVRPVPILVAQAEIRRDYCCCKIDRWGSSEQYIEARYKLIALQVALRGGVQVALVVWCRMFPSSRRLKRLFHFNEPAFVAACN
jgi:hypothetical protein